MLDNLEKKVSVTIYPGTKNVKIIPIIIAISVITLFVYFLTSAGNTPYNYFTRLSSSFLEGKYYLEENPPWLSELVPIGQNKFTFVNPPMPAILGIPFILLFGKDFPQQILAHLFGAGSVFLIGLISWELKKDKKITIWSMLLLGVGNIFWYLSATGSVWYLGQVISVFFVLLALFESLTKKRLIIISFTLACVFLSRPQVLLSLPFFLYLVKDKLNKKSVFNLYPILIGVILFLFYNFIRFGNIFNDGRTLIPGILNEPWFDKGMFSISYIKKHLEILFLSMPKFITKFPYITPSWAGLAIWITTPSFIFAFNSSLKKIENLLAWLSIILIALINFSFGSTGFSQFGYRYAVDFYPFLFFLTICGIKKLKWYHWSLLIVCIVVNTWGVIFINKLNLVSF